MQGLVTVMQGLVTLQNHISKSRQLHFARIQFLIPSKVSKIFQIGLDIRIPAELSGSWS